MANVSPLSCPGDRGGGGASARAPRGVLPGDVLPGDVLVVSRRHGPALARAASPGPARGGGRRVFVCATFRAARPRGGAERANFERWRRSPPLAWPEEEGDDDDDAAAAAAFAGGGYATLRRALPPGVLRAARRHLAGVVGWRRTALEGARPPFRRVVRDEACASQVHRALTKRVSRAVGLGPLKPSYCLVAEYPRGAALPKHVDRRPCAFTLSVLVRYGSGGGGGEGDGDGDGGEGESESESESGAAAPWPLRLDLPGGAVADATWAPGDGLLYKGCEIPHSRAPLDADAATYIFFHWVLPDSRGPLR